jgi:Ca-activated chloride channel family protein
MSNIPDIDPYAALGIPQDAPLELIEVAYELLAKRYPKEAAGTTQRPIIDRAYELLTSKNMAFSAMKQQSRVISARRHFSMAVTTSRTNLPVITDPQALYLRVDLSPTSNIKTDEMNPSKGRLNLTLVLDRSNSMQGTRLDRVKGAAYQIIDTLQSDDVISVVAFSDRATTLISATKATDKPRLKAQIALMSAFGGTELYHGLSEGLRQNREFLDPQYVNHVLVITDGNTYGDEEQCIQLASNAAIEGITISAMGLGTDWNDDFLDKIATTTGGHSQFIRSVQEVGVYISTHVRHLSSTFAERIRFLLRFAEGVKVTQAFKISPIPQPLEANDREIRVGILEAHRPTSVVIQLQLPPNLPPERYDIGRLIVTGDILTNSFTPYHQLMHLVLPTTPELIEADPPTAILDALSRLALYRMQESANEAIKRGDVLVATQRLEKLATRLLAMGQSSLATHVLQEAQLVKTTHMLSAEGKKTIKYHTRQLVMETRRVVEGE